MFTYAVPSPLDGGLQAPSVQHQRDQNKGAALLRRRTAMPARPQQAPAASAQEDGSPLIEVPERKGFARSLIDMAQPGLSRRQVIQAAGAVAAAACPCCPTGPAMAAADWDYGEQGCSPPTLAIV